MAQLTKENPIGDIDMAKNKTVTYNYRPDTYKGKTEHLSIKDKKVGDKKTVSKLTFGEKAGPKGFRRKAKVVDKKTPAGKRSTAIYGSNRTMKSIGPDMAAGKGARKELKQMKQDADSVTIGKKTYKTKNKEANPNLRKNFKGGGMMKKRSKKKRAKAMGGGMMKKRMKRGGRAK